MLAGINPLKETLELVNKMQADGVICHYAIGGALAAASYSEPATTLEIEVFVVLPFNSSGAPVGLRWFHDYVVAQGCKQDGECFDVRGWPVHFFPASSNLEREAVAASLPLKVDTERVWVMMAEHLIAIALTTTRAKDLPWMVRLIEWDAIDELTLKSILKTHGLTGKWAEFEQKFPPCFPNRDEMRRRLAALSFTEKVKILEKLRDREQLIAAAGSRGSNQKSE